ncbi:hypothetical protein C0V70_13440 [Bacteriovorax stolpii]|uniref:Uncharacterized protein n=1 Tax=Bacteriovorax stolpii TaxID=960 RepID=A0A2K9NVJ5_BACTC|nr:DUF4231 domain-containing protein [Bacteriovorax stolpii]AUN99085.1 hypothetical protein C0V70_13440 [Bacteriovorax stolpii]TDP55385.1 uncharacterized protein DUF4231 [Bacteriovorax stolpii]
MKFKENDYPSIYLSADKASIQAQNFYLWLIKIDLALMIVAALLTVFNYQDLEVKRNINGISALLFSIAFILSIMLRLNRFEKTWYGGRAVAESVKSLTWKYITKAKPFDTTTDEKSTSKLIELLKEITSKKNDLAFNFEINDNDMITHKMKEIRSLPTKERLEFYNEERLLAQRKWYVTKAKYNKTQGNYFFISTLITQFIGLGFSIYLVTSPNSINPIGVLSSITVALFSWMQIRKFQELSQAYSLTANELGLALAESTSITSDKDLSNFVNESESAISREHTMWSARRN